MNEKNSGKRVRALQKHWIIAGIIVAVVLMLVAVIAIPHFLTQPRYSNGKKIPSGVRMIPVRLVPYHVDPNLYPAARTVDESADTISTGSLPISPREAKE